RRRGGAAPGRRGAGTGADGGVRTRLPARRPADGTGNRRAGVGTGDRLSRPDADGRSRLPSVGRPAGGGGLGTTAPSRPRAAAVGGAGGAARRRRAGGGAARGSGRPVRALRVRAPGRGN